MLTLVICLCAAALGEEWYYTMDFDYAREVAPDTVAWIYQPQSDINQPLVFSTDWDYYLSHRYDRTYSGNGAIYVTGGEAPDFSDPVIILRGNNCMDYSLFGNLSEYRREEFCQQHPYFEIITPEGNYRLDVFAGLRTRHSDTQSWLVPDDDEARYAALEEVLAKSFMKADPAALPGQDDAWAILTTEAANRSGSRFVIYARKRLIPQGDRKAVQINQVEMDSRQTLNGWFTVEGVGTWMVYGQNDPVWDRLKFEVENSSRRRPFGDGGCGPTAAAMAIVNLVEKEELVKLGDYAQTPYGYRFCPCSVNEHFCNGKHLPYVLDEPDEYLRYFPIAVANFATGNNTLGVQGRRDSYGTNMSYLEELCGIFDITVTRASREEAIAFLQARRGTAVTCTFAYSPFTASSHFMALAGADEEYLYILDPLRRESYAKLDPQGVVDILTPGLVRVRIEDSMSIPMSPIYLLEKTK